jgi:hypothetical protein
MNPPRRPRLGTALAITLGAFVGDGRSAQPPGEVTTSAYSEFAAPEPGIEIYHGAVKIGPSTPAMRPPVVSVVPAPVVETVVPAAVVAPAEAKGLPGAPDARVSDAVVDTLYSVREDSRKVSTAAAVMLGRMGTWLKAPQPEPRLLPVVCSQPVGNPPSTFTPSSAPWLTPIPAGWPTPPPPAVTPPTQVIVIREPVPTQPMPAPVVQPPPVISFPAPAPAPAPIVIREPAPAAVPAAEPARGITLTPELLIGLAVGVFGIGFGLAARFRELRPRQSEETPQPVVPSPSPAVPENVLMVGGYNAGPVPELAEKFELGPSYEEEQQEKKRAEEQSSQAVLEFILAQNLALQAAAITATESRPETV